MVQAYDVLYIALKIRKRFAITADGLIEAAKEDLSDKVRLLRPDKGLYLDEQLSEHFGGKSPSEANPKAYHRGYRLGMWADYMWSNIVRSREDRQLMDTYQKRLLAERRELAAEQPEIPDSVPEITAEAFDELLAALNVTFVNFYGPSCRPCTRLIAPFAELESQYREKASFAKVNAHDAMTLQMRYHIMGVPTIIAFQNGEENERMVGFSSTDELHDFVRRNLLE